MTYHRVIPRDLFNEANLLKCLAHLWICFERSNVEAVYVSHDGGPFQVEQDPSDGSIEAINVRYYIRDQALDLCRPLNSREPWPLQRRMDDGSAVPVFNEDGELSDDFLASIQKEAVR